MQPPSRCPNHIRSIPIKYDFAERLGYSAISASEKQAIETHLAKHYGETVTLERANASDDKAGVDYWVRFASASRKPIGVDLKVRSRDYGDVALETLRNVEWKLVGWAADESKSTDAVVFFWRDSNRVAGPIAFSGLVAAVKANLPAWKGRFKTATTTNARPRYTSDIIFVPFDVLSQAVATATKRLTYEAQTQTMPLPFFGGGR